MQFYVDEESAGHRFHPLVDGTVPVERPQPPGIMGHEVQIQFVHHLVIIHPRGKDVADKPVQQRTAVLEEELSGDCIVAGDKALDDIVFLPGAILEVAPEAQLRVPLNTRLYLYDEAEWGSYKNHRYATVTYSPSWKTCPRDTVLVSAQLHVGGTVQVEGALYTTASGANITGEDSTAHVVFVNGAAPSDVIYQLTGDFENRQYTAQPVTSAALRNDDGSLRQTVEAEAGESFIHKYGLWRSINDLDTMTNLNTTGVSPLDSRGRVVIRHNTPYILLPDGRMYTILGVPAKKED